MICSPSLRSLFSKRLLTATKLTLILFLLGGLSYSAEAATITVNAGGNLQGAIDSSACGDEIVLQAGASFLGNFVLRYKGTCSGTDADYITIRTSNLAGITPPGTRITPSNASAMAKLVANSAAPALEAEAQAHHYKLIGIELTNVGGGLITQELVLLGARSSGGSITFAQQPHHITFDRCWIHEATNDTTTPDNIFTTAIRGFNLNATDVTITESRIAGFRAYQTLAQGVESSNAILFPSSALRVTVQNNYLEAWFCPVFFGGSGGQTPNTATLSNPTYNASAHTGTAIFSSISNLALLDLVAMKTTGGHTPPTNSAHPNESVVFQVAQVTAISANTVSFKSWGSYDGNLAGGNPLLQVPDSPGQAQWKGYLNQDITIRRNQFVENFATTEQVWTSTGGSPTTQPRSTQTSTGNAPKGLIEIKMGKNILIDGNTFEGWSSGLVITSRNQGGTLTSGGFPWAGLFNVTITNNWWKRAQNWDRIYEFPIGGPQLEDNEFSDVRSGPFTLSNNLIESGVEAILASMAAADNVTVVHNTYPGSNTPLGGNSMIFGQGANSPSLVFKDNILSNNEYGLNCQIPSTICWPGVTDLQGKIISGSAFNHNVIIDNRSSGAQTADGPLSNRYNPTTDYNLIASNQTSIGWMDTANRDYRLASNSFYKGKASDGTDPGVNWTTLVTGLGFDPINNNPAPTPTPTPTPPPQAWTHGYNFRATLSFVTDASDESGVLGTDIYPTNRNGVTFGFGSSYYQQARDRSAGNDRRLAGIYSWTGPSPGNDTTFTIDLPSPGDYDVALASGDAGYAISGANITVKDGSTNCISLTGLNAPANQFFDATGVLRTNTSWSTTNVVKRCTFNTGKLTLTVNDKTTIAHIRVTRVVP